jgi:hypothetical protein
MHIMSKISMCLLLFPRILLECLCLAGKEIDHVFVLEVSILSCIVLMYFGTIPTVFYHLFYLYYHFKNSVQLIGLVQKNTSELFHQVLFSNDIATKLLTFVKQYVSYFLAHWYFTLIEHIIQAIILSNKELVAKSFL